MNLICYFNKFEAVLNLILLIFIVLNSVNKLKYIFVFMGPKGSGKTFLCRLIEERLGIKFLDTESVFKSIQTEGITTEENIIKAYAIIEKEIEKYLPDSDSITFESTGIADEFWRMIKRLKKKYSVKFISVYAPENICLQRIRTRNQEEHISIDETAVRQVNMLCGSLEYDSAMRVFTANPDNEKFLRDFELLLKTI